MSEFSYLYAERDLMQLDKDGSYYCRHVSAMTREGLHSKSDIAAELGFRDSKIDRLEQELQQLVQDKAELVELLKYCKKAFLNQVEFDLIRESAKQETQEIAESIHQALEKHK